MWATYALDVGSGGAKGGSAPALVGRNEILDALGEASERPGGTTVALVGPPGIGKSTVVRAFSERCGAPVLVGRCAPPPATPMRALTELLVGALSAGAALDDVDATVFGPAVRRLLGTSNPVTDPEQHALTTGEGLRIVLDGCGDGRVVCVVEDLHWADDETIAVLDYLVDHLAASSILLLVTARTHESTLVDDTIDGWRRREVAIVRELPRFTDDQVVRVVSDALTDDIPEAFVRAVVRASEGNPLLVTEFVREAKIPDGVDAVAVLPIPTSYRSTIARRVGALPDAVRAGVQAAALAGRTLDPTLLHRIGVPAPSEVVAHAIRGQLAEPGPTDAPAPRFRHALTREAVIGTLTDAERTRLATDALRHLAPDDGHPLEDAELEVASQLAAAAGDAARACSLLVQGARRAIAMGATAHALRRLDLADGLPVLDHTLATAIQECRVEALGQAGRAVDALEIGEKLVAELARQGETERLGRVQLALARASGSRSEWYDAASRLDATFDDLDRAPAEVQSYRAIVAIEHGDIDRAHELATRALARDDLPATGRCEAHEVLGRVARETDYHAAAEHFRAGVEVATEAGLDLWRTRSLLELGMSEATSYGRGELFAEASHSARRSGALALSALCDYNLANLHGMRFEPAPSIEAADRAIENARRVGSGMLEALGWLTWGQSQAMAGARARSKLAGDRARAAAPGDEEVDALASAMCFGFPDLLSGDFDTAVEHYVTSLGTLLARPQKTGTAPWYFGPTVLAAAGHELGEACRDELHQPWAQAVATFEGQAHLVDAILAGRTDGPTAAARHLALLDESLERHRELTDAVIGIWHTLRSIAAPAAIADGWGDPVGDLQRAEAFFAGRGQDLSRRWCAGLLRDAGVSPRTRGKAQSDVPEALATYDITNREYDVLVLLGERLTNREIAERLLVSASTVKTHVERLLTKTNRANRVELAELVHAVGPE